MFSLNHRRIFPLIATLVLGPWSLVILSALVASASAQPANVQADPTTGALSRPTTALFVSGNSLLTPTSTSTLTNKSISGATNTLTAIPNSSLGNSSITLGSSALNLGSTITTVAGLTLTSPVLGNATATSITAPASTDLTFSGGSTSGKILFNSPSATERARLTSTGNLLIGTTTDMSGSGGLKIAGTTAASSTTSGALIVAGGVGVSGAGYFGGLIGLSGAGSDATTGINWGTSTTLYQTQAGRLALNHVGGTLPVLSLLENGTPRGNIYTASGTMIVGTTGAFPLNLQTNNSTGIAIGATGIVNIPGTTASTTTTSGALIVAGGVGVSGAGYFGGNVVSNSGSNPIFSAAISGTSIGSFSAFGADVYIGVDQNANGNMIFRRNSATESMRITGSNGSVNITSTVSASAATTGALTIGNGTAATNVAIGGGNVNAGGTLTVGGAATFAGAVLTSSTTLSGAGAIPITTSLVKFTSTGAANALTLANSSDGQRLTIVHDVKGTLGTGVITPTTKTGFSTITLTSAGDTVSLVYVTTRGWMVTGSYLAVIAP